MLHSLCPGTFGTTRCLEEHVSLNLGTLSNVHRGEHDGDVCAWFDDKVLKVKEEN